MTHNLMLNKKYAPTQCRKNAKSTDGGIKKSEGWTKRAKYVQILCFCKKYNKSKENNNYGDNRLDVLQTKWNLMRNVKRIQPKL